MRRNTFLIITAIALFIYFNKQAILSYIKPYIQNYNTESEFKEIKDLLNIDNKATVNNGKLGITDEKQISLPGPLKQILSNNESESEFLYGQIIAYTNKERASAGLKPLAENSLLNKSATFKANDMNQRQYFEHESPDGKDIEDLAKNFNYEYVTIGENLAMGNFSSEQKIVEAWMNSPGHRANILNPKYTEIGIGLIGGTWQGKKVWYAVQHFGKPLADCPTVDKNLKDIIEKNQAQLSSMSQSLSNQKSAIDKTSIANSNYESLVKAYNSAVGEYNSLVNETKSKILIYNNQVKAFNSCSQN